MHKYGIAIDKRRNDNLTHVGKTVLHDRYLSEGETEQELFARVASYYADNRKHGQRLYDYMSKLWFMPSTPILSNGGTDRGLPISCFLNEVPDNLPGIVDSWNECVWLASKGGGIGSYWGNVRSTGEAISRSGESSGLIPFIKVQDSLTLAISQGSLRRGSSAAYLPIDHPEIEEFIDMRKPTGDPNRKAPNIHHGVVITDAFMEAVKAGENWELKSPKTREVLAVVNARDLWFKMLTARMEMGEPYMLFIDTVNKYLPHHQKALGLKITTSNLCSEITLPTGLDHNNKMRTAVCCLSSVNLEYYVQWRDDPLFVEDILRFLDNVLSDFIDKAPPEMANAVYSAKQERSVGLGVMGFHYFLQKNNIPFESEQAREWNKIIFQNLREKARDASLKLGREKGCNQDFTDAIKAKGWGGTYHGPRFSHKIAIAPTASISLICGESSPGIDPLAANAFNQKTLSGTFLMKNKYLKKVLQGYDRDDDATWKSIESNHGSVQQLDFLSRDEKLLYKTQIELDQHWVIQHAADRTPFICQSQPVNLKFPGDVEKKLLHDVHMAAWEKGLKSLYYVRSKSLQDVDNGSTESHDDPQNKSDIQCIGCE